ncbi:MAG: thiamine pyrophosphate-binding protein, partial [candidate division NC10 bacterium]
MRGRRSWTWRSTEASSRCSDREGPMAIQTGGEWVVEALRAEGVRHVFGIPGVHNLTIYDALLRQSAIEHVLARHEAGAAFM